MLYEKNLNLANKEKYEIENIQVIKKDIYNDYYYEDYRINSNIINVPIQKIHYSNSIDDFTIYRYEDYVENVKLKYYKQQIKDKLDERNCLTYIYSLIC